MKTIFNKAYICLVFLLPMIFTGCQKLTQYREPEQQYLISAIGFDNEDNELKVSLEVIIFSVGKAESSIESKVFSGKGQTVKQALGNLSSEVAKKLLYGHCALIVLGESITDSQVDEIFQFCSSGKDIPISASLVSTTDAMALLSCKSISTPVTGYDITGVLKQKSEDWGIGLTDRLYEVETKRLDQNSYYALPYFSVSTSEDKTVYTFSGIRIYENDRPALLFDLPQSALYSLLTDTYGSGTFYVESDGIIYQPEVKRASSSVKVDGDCGRTCITVKMRLLLRRGQTEKIDAAALSGALEKKAIEFIKSTETLSTTDIFEIASRLGYPNDTGVAISDIDISFDISAPGE